MVDSTACERLSAVDSTVRASSRICREHVVIEFVLPAFPRSDPGQFLQLRCADGRAVTPRELDWPKDGFPSLTGAEWRERRAFLRRPLSIADQWSDRHGPVHLRVISRTVGPGTAWLERLQPGDTLNVTGPLGRGFRLPRRQTPTALIGGGVGIPPLLYLARRLHDCGQPDVTMILGASTRHLLPISLLGEPARDGTPSACVDLPGQAYFPAIITTDDGSAGLSGFATDGLQEWQRRRSRSESRGLVFACGPEAMLQEVARLTRQLDLDCQLCIERTMACGLGTCLSCVVRRHDPTQAEGWGWALACQDGPVFDRDELLDYGLPARA